MPEPACSVSQHMQKIKVALAHPKGISPSPNTLLVSDAAALGELKK